MAPPELALGLQSLPPMLHMYCQNSMLGYSKGPRGLSVLPWERGIFTSIPISPSPLWRQCPSRYAVHARHQLDDKEFRYLRTLIVRAAIREGFGCKLHPKANLLP